MEWVNIWKGLQSEYVDKDKTRARGEERARRMRGERASFVSGKERDGQGREGNGMGEYGKGCRVRMLIRMK